MSETSFKVFRERKSPLELIERAFLNNPGDFLLSHAVTRAVPSAPAGLTSVFGMGTGVTLPTKSPENLFEISNRQISEIESLRKSNSDVALLRQVRASANACCLSKFYGQAMGLISSGQLNTLLHLHIHPINLVVYEESHWQD